MIWPSFAFVELPFSVLLLILLFSINVIRAYSIKTPKR